MADTHHDERQDDDADGPEEVHEGIVLQHLAHGGIIEHVQAACVLIFDDNHWSNMTQPMVNL